MMNPLDAEALRRLIAKTRYAVASNSKHIIQGALLTMTGPAAAMVSTDSKRLALATMGRAGTDMQVVVPTKTLDLLMDQGDVGDLELTVGGRHLFFKAGRRTLDSVLLGGEFPAYQRIIPKENTNVVTVGRLALMAALRRVGLVAEETRATFFNITPTTIELSAASAEVGSADEVVPIEYTGTPMKVCIDWKYVLDFLDAAYSDKVGIALKNPTSAALFTDGKDYIAVIMLMRVEQ